MVLSHTVQFLTVMPHGRPWQKHRDFDALSDPTFAIGPDPAMAPPRSAFVAVEAINYSLRAFETLQTLGRDRAFD
jgi:hypothetical protein